MAAQITAVIIFLVMFAFIITENSAVLQRSFSCLVSVCTVPLRYSRH